MRSRKVIEEERNNKPEVIRDFHITDITTEILLDIRELLIKLNKKNKSFFD